MSHGGYTQLPSGSNNRDHDQQQHLVVDTYRVLHNMKNSLDRSNQIASETEQIGTEVLSDLGTQRESLLRTTDRLENIDHEMSEAQRTIRKLSRSVLHNKIVLILIIVIEVLILIGASILKFTKF
ncbi:vesicle transport through interaction with t-SNAREs homolog 1B [Scaptodrosophila lebanonensis]|uniref:Vesicle transport through interaction with t-SNAREs homolog 1B n=1 Tax=Drosophila lebanonensis TaxID=7225 RepID=A0A6J2SXB2_DROLE|nr:vesicle transport through interaction with t-SNAREs homolog 1B [Scaptodrosophila lebanonensis]XP_030369222.1 vesicle transport through interaction with t-SNAREs homolog 1B [Scaptodrosophila lebanonensis]